jgi:DNA-binding Xre family transcriptional regulator
MNMGKRGQSRPPAIALRKILAANVRRRMDERYKERGDRPKALAEAAGVTLSTVQRIIKHEIGATIDTVDMIAKALRCEPDELLREYHDPGS